MSNIASVRKEVRMLERVLAPKTEPEWQARAAAITQSLREYEQIKKESGFYELSPKEQVESELALCKELIEDFEKQGFWKDLEEAEKE